MRVAAHRAGCDRRKHFAEGETSMRRAIVKLLCGCVLVGLLAPATAWAQDGSIVAWGANNEGQCDVPPDTDFVAVAGGGSPHRG